MIYNFFPSIVGLHMNDSGYCYLSVSQISPVPEHLTEKRLASCTSGLTKREGGRVRMGPLHVLSWTEELLLVYSGQNPARSCSCSSHCKV